MLSSGIWLKAASLSDSSLSGMVPGLIDLQLDAKAPSTVMKYKSGWLRWREWAMSKIDVPVIPAKPLHIALFISELQFWTKLLRKLHSWGAFFLNFIADRFFPPPSPWKQCCWVFKRKPDP